MNLAKLRWRIQESMPCRQDSDEIKADFIDDDGNEFSVIGPQTVIDKLIALPCDYIDLGNAAQDRVYEATRTKDQLQEAREQVRILQQRIDAMDDTVLIPILAADLEKALNMAIRWAGALGIQANPDPTSLYGELQELAHKYKMEYIPPTHDYKKMILPVDAVVMRALSMDESSPKIADFLIEGVKPVSPYEIEQTTSDPDTRSWLVEDNDGDPS